MLGCKRANLGRGLQRVGLVMIGIIAMGRVRKDIPHGG